MGKYLINIIAGSLLTATACISSDERKPASPLETLNGDKYAPSGPAVSLGGIPVSGPFVSRKNSSTILTGKIVQDRSDGYYQSPMKFKIVLLTVADKTYRTSTDEHGNFKFSEDLKDGTYTLSLKECSDSRDVTISGFENNIQEWTVHCAK